MYPAGASHSHSGWEQSCLAIRVEDVLQNPQVHAMTGSALAAWCHCCLIGKLRFEVECRLRLTERSRPCIWSTHAEHFICKKSDLFHLQIEAAIEALHLEHTCKMFSLQQYSLLFNLQIEAAIEALDPDHKCQEFWHGKEDRNAARQGRVLPLVAADAGSAPSAGPRKARKPRRPRSALCPIHLVLWIITMLSLLLQCTSPLQ